MLKTPKRSEALRFVAAQRHDQTMLASAISEPNYCCLANAALHGSADIDALARGSREELTWYEHEHKKLQGEL